MPALNKVMIIGNCVADPTAQTLPSGTVTCGISIAVNNTHVNDDGTKTQTTTYLEVNAFGKTASNCAAYLRKGAPVFVEGRLRQDVWQDKQTGARRSKISIVAANVQFLGTHREQQQPAPAPRTAAPAPNTGMADKDFDF